MTTTSPQSHPTVAGQLRPVNLRHDLGELADLIELVFAPTMDENGRAAIREMRYMSRLGAGLSVIGHLNELAHGISLGYVWEIDGRLVGNVSLYPANWPGSPDAAWIIANVAVHPDFQRRGIARRLMRASMEMIRKRGARYGVLQVDYANHPAIALYEQLGFVRERAFTTWIRRSGLRAPQAVEGDLFLTRRRPRDWRREYALAQATRPPEQGGIGWQKPLHPHLFRKPLAQRLMDWFRLGSIERMAAYDARRRDLLATLWIEQRLGSTSTHLTLLNDPTDASGAAEALLNNTVRRLRTSHLVLEHPHDDLSIKAILNAYQFITRRTVWHMRWDVG